MNNKQNGFSAVAVLLVLILVAVIVFAGWRVMNSQESDTSTTPAITQPQNEVPEVNNNDDLQRSEDFLNGTDIDSELDTSELDSVLSE